jgi:hypothetical protein
MKTHKEILIQAKAYAESIGNEDGTSAYDYVMGYNKCQEDMAEKRYTEEDIRKAIEVGINAEAGYYPKGFSHKLEISLEDYFINSLNKQD